MQHLMTTVENIDDLIEAFGGASCLGRFLGITSEAVSMWRARGEIPPGWHFHLFIESRLRGFDLAPSVFGYADDESARKFREALNCHVA